MSLPVEKRRQWIKSRREQRKHTKYARLRRQLLRYSVLLSVFAAGIFIFYRIQCHLYDGKDNVIIKGNLVANNDQISQALKSDTLKTPLFLLNPTVLEDRIKSLSMVKYAFVRRYLLPRPLLTVEVLEEFPWASIYCAPPTLITCPTPSPILTQNLSKATETKTEYGMKAPFVIAESGRLISVKDFPNVYQPALKIFVQDPAQFKFNQADVEQWANWLGYISKQTSYPVTALDMRESHNIKVETSKFSIVLGNPDSGLTRRLNRLSSVLEVLASQHKEAVYINLALNSNIPVKLAKKSDKTTINEKVSSL
jgi:hypothetical protein